MENNENCRRDYQAERIQKSEKVIEDFANLVNGGADLEAFLNKFDREHRTLQQSMFGVIMKLICHIAEDNFRTDGRNEQTKKLAQDLILAYGEQFKAKELDYYLSSGFSGDEAEKRAKENLGYYLKNPADYLTLRCI